MKVVYAGLEGALVCMGPKCVTRGEQSPIQGSGTEWCSAAVLPAYQSGLLQVAECTAEIAAVQYAYGHLLCHPAGFFGFRKLASSSLVGNGASVRIRLSVSPSERSRPGPITPESSLERASTKTPFVAGKDVGETRMSVCTVLPKAADRLPLVTFMFVYPRLTSSSPRA